jgi:predicted metal-dependent phosphoesterase TrpH
MYTVDLHAHTRFFHGFPGRPTPFDPLGANLLALSARYHGLDGVALTNHDYYSDFETVLDEPKFIPGVEISTTDGHALVIGPDPPARTTPGQLTPDEVVTIAHEADCAAIIAHPYRRGSVRESGADFDAVEINGKHPRNIEYVRNLADSLNLPIVGGSDAHYPFEAGRSYTAIDSPDLTPESVVNAIRNGRVEPRVRDNAMDRILRWGYRRVHQYRRG